MTEAALSAAMMVALIVGALAIEAVISWVERRRRRLPENEL